MGHIRDNIREFEDRGANVVMILAQNTEGVKEYLAAQPHPFPVLPDETREVVKAYGVYVHVNLESYNIARPAVFLVDSKGIIRYMHIGYHQADYPTAIEVLTALDGMMAGRSHAA